LPRNQLRADAKFGNLPTTGFENVMKTGLFITCLTRWQWGQ